MTISDDQLRTLVYRSCLCLDEGDWDGYLDLCAADFNYQVVNYSPELRQDMVWMEQDRAGLVTLFGNLENHITRPGQFLRHASVALIEPNGDGGAAKVTSSFVIAYTELDGISSLFAVGRYYDVVDTAGDAPLLRARQVRLHTRDLEGGSHFPI